MKAHEFATTTILRDIATLDHSFITAIDLFRFRLLFDLFLLLFFIFLDDLTKRSFFFIILAHIVILIVVFIFDIILRVVLLVALRVIRTPTRVLLSEICVTMTEVIIEVQMLRVILVILIVYESVIIDCTSVWASQMLRKVRLTAIKCI